MNALEQLHVLVYSWLGWGAVNLHAMWQNPLFAHYISPWQWARVSPAVHYAYLQAHPALQPWLKGESGTVAIALGSLLSRPLWMLVRRVPRLRSAGRSHGTAGWAGWWGRRRLWLRRGECAFVVGYARKGIVHRRLGVQERDRSKNVLLLGPPDYGKSTAFIIPNLLMEDGRRHLIITDAKGELWTLTAGALCAKGYRVIRIDWFDGTSQGWNPLDECEHPLDAMMLAKSWVHATSESEHDQFWDEAAEYLLQATILHLVATQEHPTLRDVEDFLTQTTREHRLTALRTSKSEDARRAARAFLDVLPGNERLQASVWVGLPLRFMVLTDPAIRSVLGKSDFRFRDLVASAGGDRPSPPIAVYLTMPRGAAQIALIKPVMSAFFGGLFTYLGREAPLHAKGALPRPVFCYLDEAGTIGKIVGLEDVLAQMRSAGVGAVLALQSLRQLDRLYGREAAQIITACCYTKIALAGLDDNDAERISKSLGDATARQQTASGSRKRGAILIEQGNLGESETRRALLTADEVRRLGDREVVVWQGNKRPIKLRQRPYFRSPRLNLLASIAAPRRDAAPSGPTGPLGPIGGRQEPFERTPVGAQPHAQPRYDIDWTLPDAS